MKEMMATLAENYQLGIGVITGILVIMYITISVLAIIKRRKVYGNVSVLGMIPFYNITFFFSAKKKAKEDKKALDALNQEVIEDMF